MIGYDYSTPGAYFITICTIDRKNYFWSQACVDVQSLQDIVLNSCGEIVKSAIQNISVKYPNVSVDHYVIMPDHIHLLLQIHGGEQSNASIKQVIQQMKGFVTKQVGKPFWQKLYHDHIIRGQEDYDQVWNYIELNPIRSKDNNLYPIF